MLIKKSIAKAIAKTAKYAAKSSMGYPSWFGYHQPKEPKNLKEFFKNSENK